MRQSAPAKLLRVHVFESDRLGDKPLYEAIVTKCRELKIAGATVFRGLEGYGDTGQIRSSRLLHNDRPILITIVDTAENIARLIPAIEPMIDTGMISESDVQVIRVQKS